MKKYEWNAMQFFKTYRYKRKSSAMIKKKPNVSNAKQHLAMKSKKKPHNHDCEYFSSKCEKNISDLIIIISR